MSCLKAKCRKKIATKFDSVAPALSDESGLHLRFVMELWPTFWKTWTIRWSLCAFDFG